MRDYGREEDGKTGNVFVSCNDFHQIYSQQGIQKGGGKSTQRSGEGSREREELDGRKVVVFT